MGVQMPQYMYNGQKTMCGNRLSPSTVKLSRFELGTWGLAISTFTC